MDMNDLQLYEFAEFMLRRSLCQQGKEKYFVHWVKRFFNEVRDWPPDSWKWGVIIFVRLLFKVSFVILPRHPVLKQL